MGDIAKSLPSSSLLPSFSFNPKWLPKEAMVSKRIYALFPLLCYSEKYPVLTGDFVPCPEQAAFEIIEGQFKKKAGVSSFILHSQCKYLIQVRNFFFYSLAFHAGY